MLVAHQAVNQKINSVKSSVGNTITVSPAGFRGFGGGGNPITQDQLSKVKSLAHVTSVSESLTDRLTSSNTNLQSAVDAGALGQRFAQNGGQPPGGGFGGGNPDGNASFTPPVTVVGTTAPSDLSSGFGGGGGGTFTLKSGKLFNSTSSDNVAVIGTSLAAKNNLKVGSTFTAYGTDVTVIGIYDSGTTFGNNQVIMPLAAVQKLSDQAGDVTSAKVTVDSVGNLGSATTAVKNAMGSSADVTDDQSNAQTTIQPLENIKSISLYSLIGAVIAGGIIILLSMIMIVRERRREIGVLKAIGASNLKVMWQFMAEAVTLTILGAAIGTVIGVVAANPITRTLVSNSASTTTMAGGPGGGPRGGGLGFVRNNVTNIHAAVGWSIILYGLLAAIIIALIGSTFSSYIISKIRPAEVMRSE